jgi:hypothetical protein
MQRPLKFPFSFLVAAALALFFYAKFQESDRAHRATLREFIKLR